MGSASALRHFVGAGSAEGSLDAANILKPALSRGEIRCIGATTPAEYRKYIEKDRSLKLTRIVLGYGLQHLDYQDLGGANVVAPNRSDVVQQLSYGIGYHAGRDLRIGVNLGDSRRTSPLSTRQYSGLKFGISLTYGSS